MQKHCRLDIRASGFCKENRLETRVRWMVNARRDHGSLIDEYLQHTRVEECVDFQVLFSLSGLTLESE